MIPALLRNFRTSWVALALVKVARVLALMVRVMTLMVMTLMVRVLALALVLARVLALALALVRVMTLMVMILMVRVLVKVEPLLPRLVTRMQREPALSGMTLNLPGNLLRQPRSTTL